ncbi:hypothetical protein [Nonomuraea sp. NPDC052265]|uniref:hypothetical protein n=1 Tax=Nonomuraea sp. NPDC052265 TaxID=3364374 RepID=UPI0037C84F25
MAVPAVTRLLWSAAVTLVTLTSGLTLVRLLAMPVELGYDRHMYVRFNEAAYPGLAYVGGVAELLAVVVTVPLAIVERRTNRFRLVVMSGFLTIGALLLWALVVQPANDVFGTWSRQPPPLDWHAWRMRWELGQVGNFVLTNGALLLLLTAATGRRRVTGRAVVPFLRRPSRGSDTGILGLREEQVP